MPPLLPHPRPRPKLTGAAIALLALLAATLTLILIEAPAPHCPPVQHHGALAAGKITSDPGPGCPGLRAA